MSCSWISKVSRVKWCTFGAMGTLSVFSAKQQPSLTLWQLMSSANTCSEREDAFDWRLSVKNFKSKTIFALCVFFYDSVLSCMNNLEEKRKNKSQRRWLPSNPLSPVVGKKKQVMTTKKVDKKPNFCPWICWTGAQNVKRTKYIYIRDESENCILLFSYIYG